MVALRLLLVCCVLCITLVGQADVSNLVASDSKTSEDPKVVKEYLVKKGDNLRRIAKLHHISVGTLKRWNKLSRNKIRPGMSLKVSPSAEQAPSKLSLNYVLGHFHPRDHPEFVKLRKPYSDGKNRYLRKEVADAFIQMAKAAKKDGIRLRVVSATRTYLEQKRLWTDKWVGRKIVGGKNFSKIANHLKRAESILRYSSMPGSSRHHWGTDLDLNRISGRYFREGKGLKVYRWMQANAHKFGFCQPYDRKSESRKFGYAEERWHWSHRPSTLSIMGFLNKHFRDAMISGFAGSKFASRLSIKKHYMLSISKHCL